MSKISGRGKTTTRKILVKPKRKQKLLKKATELAKTTSLKAHVNAGRLFAGATELDVPRIEAVIAQCRRMIALQYRLLDDLEAEVEGIKRDSRKKTPAKSKKRQT